MKPVTNPEILRKLGGNDPSYSSSPQPVTDPNIIAKLNAQSKSKPPETPAQYTGIYPTQGEREATGKIGEGALGALQSYINTPEEAANAFNKHLYNKFDFAPNTNASKIGEVGGDISSYFLPSNLVTGGIKGLKYVPVAKNMINQASEIMKNKPLTNYLLKLIKSGGEASLFQKEKFPNSTPSDIAQAGGAGAGLQAATSALGATNPLINLGAKLGLGGALGYQANGWPGAVEGAGLGVFAPKVLKELGLGPRAPVSSEFLTEMPTQEAKKAYEAGNRIGTPLRPSEAFNNTSMAANEGRIENTETGKAAMDIHAKERVIQQKQSINNLLNKIYPKTKKAANNIRSLYEKAYQKNLTQNEVHEIFQDPVLRNANKKILSDPAYSKDLADAGIDNIAYLDQVKRTVDDMRKAALKAGESNKARIYKDSSEKLVQKLDEISPEYKAAREAAQKKIIRRDLEKSLGTKEINGRNFFDTVLRNENKYQELLVKLKNSPEALQHIKDMKIAWENLIGKDTVRTAAGMSAKNTNSARVDASKFWNLFKDTIGAPRDIQRADFIHNPKWWEKFDEVANYKDRLKKKEAFADLFGRGMSSALLESSKIGNKEK
jgi:hypothetical protein